MDVTTGQIGRYQLLRQIGEGGMGVVHLAIAPDDSRVAVKVLRPHVIGDAESRERLSREVAALRRISSVRVAACIDADPWGRQPYVVTRFVPGLSLAEYVREYGPIGGENLRRVAVGLAEALAAVHRVGVIHRDVKPNNVLLERDEPVLIDFGLAMALDESRMTHAGWLLGTPAYLAPEIVLGRDPTAAADIHAWAATIAFACTGRSPFGGGPAIAVMDRVRRGEHDLTGVPDGLRGVLQRCLNSDPVARPTAEELSYWLIEERTPQPMPVPTPDRTRLVTPPVESQALWGEGRSTPLAHRPMLERLLRVGATVALAALAAGLSSVAPYLTAFFVLCLSAAVRADRRVRSLRWRRHLRRGPRRRDPAQDMAGWPVQFARSIPRAALSTGAAGLAAGLAAVAIILAGTSTRSGVVLAGGVFVAMTWWGPGAHALRPTARRAVATLGRPGPVTYIALWVLTIAVFGTYAALETHGTWWVPFDRPPWSGWGWRRG